MGMSGAGAGGAHLRSLDNSKSWWFQSVRLTFAATSQARTVCIEAGCGAEIELVDFDRTGELLIASNQQTQCMPHTSRCLLADT